MSVWLLAYLAVAGLVWLWLWWATLDERSIYAPAHRLALVTALAGLWPLVLLLLPVLSARSPWEDGR